ncbi:leucine-rich repeat flightless-interacting protein 1 isoform X6 [Amblyraja radiata]|uniref:leucine-rich repeat flightless-interacting protein 1 isoform X6 n=1 Tax=Amblyraja radiata TaxID=386614 RepID=UPI001402F2F6|nr:leucine-rich repeat flightless-interacting protein 1 isoform X6 [Amblyraja radiata]
MGTQGSGRKRIANRERLSAEDDTLNLIAREAEARLAAKRAARAEAREIRMKELERQQKEIYQVQKKYYGLDTKWGDIEQWMEDSEKYSRRFRRHTSVSDEDDWTSVGSRGSARADYESVGASGGSSRYSDAHLKSAKQRLRKEAVGSYYSDLPVLSTGLGTKSQNGTRMSTFDGNASRRYSTSTSRAPSEYNCVLGSSSRTSSRASSARASPVVEEKLDKDFTEKGSRAASSLSAATLASLGGTSSRRGSGETTTSIDTEGSIREIKDSLMEVEEKYKKAMVSNAQLDNEKANLMYQVDTLREDLLGLEEQLAEMHRGHEEKSKELERQKHAYCILQHQFEEMKETLQEREEMLTEIKELNQKQRSFAQEITDLQETLEWKDKKIGALERQKEYSEAIRIDRDELRNEVMMLKERLKAHGLMTNGEAEHVGKEGSAHRETAQTRPQAEAQQQSSSDKPLGECHGLQMRNEILKAVEQKGNMQNTGTDEQMDKTGNREMLMDNVEEKDKTESFEELTETDTPTVTVRDNANADQIECTAANLDDRVKSAFDTQNTGGKEVTERINSVPRSEETMQSYSCREEGESGSDLRIEVNQLQENAKETLNDEARFQNEQGDPGCHGGMIKEKHIEIGNDVNVVHNDVVGTGADYQMIVEKTQQIVQNVVEKAVEIIRQEMSGHELQEKLPDLGEDICVGIVSHEVKRKNLTRTQEIPAESNQVDQKELGRVVIQKTEHEQAVIGTVLETEICSSDLQGDVIKSEETGPLLVMLSDQNDQLRSSGEGIYEIDDTEKEGLSDQGRKKQPIVGGFTVSEELEEVEEMAEKVEVVNGLTTGAAMQELEENKDDACRLGGEKEPVKGDEVNHALIHNEDQEWRDDVIVKESTETCPQDEEIKDCELGKEQLPNEDEPNTTAKPEDGARQLSQHQKVEGSLEHDCLLKVTLNEEKNETETENESNIVEFESEVKTPKGNEDRARELGEDDKGVNAGKVKCHGSDKSENNMRESDIEDYETDEGTDKETGTDGILYYRERWVIDEVSKSEGSVKSSKADVDGGNDRDNDQENDSNIASGDRYETIGSKEDTIKNQKEYKANLKSQGEKIAMDISGDISSEFKILADESEFQRPSSNIFGGPEEEDDEIKCSKVEEKDESQTIKEVDDDAIGEEEVEVISPIEENNEVNIPRGDGEEVKSTREGDNSVKGIEGTKVKNSRVEEEIEVRSPKEDDEVKDEEGNEIKSPRDKDDEVGDEEEDDVKSYKEDDEVKDEEVHEVKIPRETQDEVDEEEVEVKGSKEDDNVKDEERDEVKSPREEYKVVRDEEEEVKSTKKENIQAKDDEGDEVTSPGREVQDVVRKDVVGIEDPRAEDKVRREKRNVVISSNVEVKEPTEKEKDEVKGPREEGGKVKNREGNIIIDPKDEDADEVKGSVVADDSSIGEDGIKGSRGDEDEVKVPRGEEGGNFKGSREEEEEEEEDMIKSPRDLNDELEGPIEEGDDVIGPRGNEGEEVKRPRGEEELDLKDSENKEKIMVKTGQKSEEQHGTDSLGKEQRKENEVCTVEKSEETKVTDLTKKENLGEIVDDKTVWHLKGQVNESSKTNQLQSKSFEEIYEGKPESNFKSVHKAMDNKIEQEMVREVTTGITEEPTALEHLQVGGEKERKQILDTNSCNKTFGDNTQTSKRVDSSSEEKDEKARCELNEEQKELAEGGEQDSSIGRVSLGEVTNQRIQDGEKVDLVTSERDTSGANKEQTIQDSETIKTRIEGTTNIQSGIVEQEIRGKDEDSEKGDPFEWDKETNEMLQGEIRDDEAPKSEEKREKTSAESAAEPRSSENLKANTDCNRDAEYDEQKCQHRNNSSRQSSYGEDQPQSESQKGMSNISGAEGNMKADEEMGLSETAKDSKRKSKSKDECSLS